MFKKIFLISICIMTIFLCGCGKREIVFQDGQHTRSEGYGASFKTKYAELTGLDVHIATLVYDENTAKEIVEFVEANYEKLRKSLKGYKNEVEVYVVIETESGYPQIDNNKVFCSLDDLETEDFLECLVRAFLDSNEYWKTVGVYEMVFNAETPVDIENLKAFYQEETHYAVQSMFPLYFEKEYAGDDVAQAARMTAREVVELMLDEMSAEDFVKSDELFDYEIQMLQTMGITVDKERIERRLKETDMFSANSYPVSLAYNNWFFYLSKEENFNTADDYYDLFVEFLDALDITMTMWKEKEPEAYLLLEEKLDDIVSFYFYDRRSGGDGNKKEIWLGESDAAIHELIHVWIPFSNNDKDFWYYEGIAMYLTGKAYWQIYVNGGGWYEAIVKGELYDTLSVADRAFCDLLADYYLQFAEMPSSYEEMDGFVLMRALSWAAVTEPEMAKKTSMRLLNLSHAEDIYLEYGYRIPDEGGNKLGYIQSTAVIDYLTETYGLDEVIRVGMCEKSFEEAFGGTFEDVYLQTVKWWESIEVNK